MSTNRPIPIVISGILGRMGQTIARCTTAEEWQGDFSIVGALEHRDVEQIGKPLNEIVSFADSTAPLAAEVADIDLDSAVFIEFCSSPDAVIEHCRAAADKGWRVVIGTTGLTDKHQSELRTLAENIPILWSPNMSMGVNLLFKLAKQVSRALGDSYDIEVVELHHKMKKDSPSGTARKLADLISGEVSGKVGESAPIICGRQPGSATEQRQGREIAVHSVRAGDIVGEHTVILAGACERLELTHRAGSRDAFGHGTLKAVQYIVEQDPGLYVMADVLGLGDS